MYKSENTVDGEHILRKMSLDQMSTGSFQERYAMHSSPNLKECNIVHQTNASKSVLDRSFSWSDTSEFEGQELIVDFSGEPYNVLKPIPITVRSLDGGDFEGAFIGGNIAWVGESRAEAINGLKAEILDTIEIFEADEDRLGPEPKRQLAVLRTYLEHTS